MKMQSELKKEIFEICRKIKKLTIGQPMVNQVISSDPMQLIILVHQATPALHQKEHIAMKNTFYSFYYPPSILNWTEYQLMGVDLYDENYK